MLRRFRKNAEEGDFLRVPKFEKSLFIPRILFVFSIWISSGISFSLSGIRFVWNGDDGDLILGGFRKSFFPFFRKVRMCGERGIPFGSGFGRFTLSSCVFLPMGKNISIDFIPLFSAQTSFCARKKHFFTNPFSLVYFCFSSFCF